MEFAIDAHPVFSLEIGMQKKYQRKYEPPRHKDKDEPERQQLHI